MTLAEYLQQHDLTATSFAEQIGVATGSVSRYASGHRHPRPTIMRRIVQVTGGAVGPQDFLGQEGADGKAV